MSERIKHARPVPARGDAKPAARDAGLSIFVEAWQWSTRIQTSPSAKASIDPKELVGYASAYQAEGGVRINVTPAANELVFEWVNPFGSTRQEFPAASETTLVAQDGTEATLVRSLPGGDVTEMILLSNGPVTRARKTTAQ